MSNTILHSLDQYALNALIRRYKSDDWLQLSDAVMCAALDGSAPLSRIEWQAVLNSPLTLRRMQILEAQRCANLVGASPSQNSTSAAKPLAIDPQWHTSVAVLRAAASGDETSTVHTDNGWWSLSFPRTHGGWMMILRLAHSAPFASLFVSEEHEPQSTMEVAVIDGKGRTLMQGMIDDEHELYGSWPLTQAPLQELKVAGGFRVDFV